MRDMSEFRQHWRPLAASFIGLGSALSLNAFVLSTFAPYLLADFRWSKSDWAAMSAVSALVIICIPLVGRLADRFGVRPVAGVGIVAFPLTTFAYSFLEGDIGTFFALYIAQTILCCTTTATIYTRSVAEKYVVWRGLALALCALSPPLVGALGSPLISDFVADYGWRNGISGRGRIFGGVRRHYVDVAAKSRSANLKPTTMRQRPRARVCFGNWRNSRCSGCWSAPLFGEPASRHFHQSD